MCVGVGVLYRTCGWVGGWVLHRMCVGVVYRMDTRYKYSTRPTLIYTHHNPHIITPHNPHIITPRSDADEGTDLAMVKQGYMSCTPLKILQHVGEATPADAAAVAAYAVLLRAAAKEGEVEVKGLPVV